ncbi:MAG: isoamylase early set domain-containing protein [Pseudomonadota bacterium]|nr:isoamylase early set domain-containing protein [Pseudomonadota bacterium]
MLTKRFFKTKQEAEVTFEFAAEADTHVSLAGEFNDWQPVSMKYVKKDQVFRTKLRLPIEQNFQFKYLINEQEWQNDHAADHYLLNEFGTDNSVVSTTRA